MKFLLPYLATLVSLVVLDGLWIGVITRSFYASQIGHLLSGKVVWGAAVLFYLLYAAGVLYFAVIPSTGLGETLLRGALLGFFAYMTYDLTNLATLKDWPVVFVAVDVAWGIVITALAAFAAAFFV